MKTALFRPQGACFPGRGLRRRGHGSGRTPASGPSHSLLRPASTRWVTARGSSECLSFRLPASVLCLNPGLALRPSHLGFSPTLPSTPRTPPGGPTVHLGSDNTAPGGRIRSRRPGAVPQDSPPAPNRNFRLSPVFLRGQRRPSLGSISL